jgi:hypothetical protein
VHSCNHCCRGKAISIIYFECVSVALGIIYHLPSFCGSLRDYKIHTDMEIVNTVHKSKGIEHTMDMCHIVICDLSGSTIFFTHYLINGTIFRQKKKVIEHITYILIFSKTLVWNISLSKKNWGEIWSKMYIKFNSIQFISLSIDPLQGVNHKDVENSHKSTSKYTKFINTVGYCISQWIYVFIQKGTL